ncbi:ABC transporter permease [Caminibacter sp.]
MKKFLAVFKKEILVFLRNVMLVFILVYAFTFDIYIAGNGVEVKPRNVTVGYVNYSGELLPQKILAHLHAPEFKKPKMFLNEKELKKAVFNKEIMVGIIFDKDFEKNFIKKREAQLNVIIDSTAAAQAEVSVQYLTQTIYSMIDGKMPVNIKIYKLFNPNSNSKWFMSLSELLSVVTMLSLVLIAVVFVREKEAGTWDIMLLMPVNGALIMFAKVFSQIFIITVGLVMGIGLILFGVFGVPINGNLFYFFLLTFFFIMAMGGIALVIAAYSNSVLEVSQYTVLVIMPLLFLSGAWTPIHSMAPWLQKLSIISPVKYYIEGAQSIFFRGTEFIDLLPYFTGEIVIGAVLFYLGYRRMGKLF